MKIYLIISDALMDCGEPMYAYINLKTAEHEVKKHICHIKEIELKGNINRGRNGQETKARKTESK